jgi:Domain of unknown function (DUF4388)
MGMVKREILAKEILNDIKAGMDDVSLMQKYRLTGKGLDSVLQKLLRAGLISERDLNARKLGFEETVDLSGLFSFQVQEADQILQKKRTEYSYSGMVEGIDILDYIQWILLDRRSTVLEIGLPNGTSCSVYLKEGEIIHAVNGELEGEEALYASVMCPSGRFGHETWSEPDRKTIEKPGTQLLLEAARRRDEEADS